MSKYKYWTVSLALMLPLLALGQSKPSYYLSLRVDYEASRLLGDDLNDFYLSYNEYHASFTSLFFDTLRANELSHFNFGLGSRIATGEDIGFSGSAFLMLGRKTIRRDAIFLTNIVTRTDLQVNDLTLHFDGGIHYQRKYFAHLQVGMRSRRNTFDVGYIYADGSYSLGNEYDILGVYQSFTSTLDLGLNLGIKVKQFYIPIGISWPVVLFPEDRLYLEDFDALQGNNQLPRDYRQWANEPAGLDPATQLVRGESFRAMRINIGLEFWLDTKWNKTDEPTQ
ncbi:MAG: hypothetical protein AAFQ87_19925 [Bacteroidota bacterium]